MKGQQKNIIKSQGGMALIETIALLFIFIILMSYGLGMWGAIHTGILHSIAARTYAFETFRNRTNLTYLREEKQVNNKYHYFEYARFHAIQSQDPSGNEFYATKRRISFSKSPASSNPGDARFHSEDIYSIAPGRYRGGSGVSDPIWVMVGYGMCLNTKCSN